MVKSLRQVIDLGLVWLFECDYWMQCECKIEVLIVD